MYHWCHVVVVVVVVVVFVVVVGIECSCVSRWMSAVVGVAAVAVEEQDGVVVSPTGKFKGGVPSVPCC